MPGVGKPVLRLGLFDSKIFLARGGSVSAHPEWNAPRICLERALGVVLWVLCVLLRLLHLAPGSTRREAAA